MANCQNFYGADDLENVEFIEENEELPKAVVSDLYCPILAGQIGTQRPLSRPGHQTALLRYCLGRLLNSGY